MNNSLNDVMSLHHKKTHSSAAAKQPLLQQLDETAVAADLNEHARFADHYQEDLEEFSGKFFAKCQLLLHKWID